jgi:mono/diheme cytochrome c family protein
MFVMLKFRDKEKGKRQKARTLRGSLPFRDYSYLHGGLNRRVALTFCLLTFAFLLGACRRDMQDQPKSIAYRESKFFKDGSASRPLVAGTVARGYLRSDREYYFGKKAGAGTGTPTATSTTTNPANPAAMFPDDVETFPIAIDSEGLERGQERYQIFCSSCHGLTGYGDGMVARRGFNKPAPASFHQEKMRQAPVGHFFDVITNGWGAMPSHASQVPVEDRWKIIAYIRALQLSQMPPESKPPATPPPAKAQEQK